MIVLTIFFIFFKRLKRSQIDAKKYELKLSRTDIAYRAALNTLREAKMKQMNEDKRNLNSSQKNEIIILN